MKIDLNWILDFIKRSVDFLELDLDIIIALEYSLVEYFEKRDITNLVLFLIHAEIQHLVHVVPRRKVSLGLHLRIFFLPSSLYILLDNNKYFLPIHTPRL